MILEHSNRKRQRGDHFNLIKFSSVNIIITNSPESLSRAVVLHSLFVLLVFTSPTEYMGVMKLCVLNLSPYGSKFIYVRTLDAPGGIAFEFSCFESVFHYVFDFSPAVLEFSSDLFTFSIIN